MFNYVNLPMMDYLDLGKIISDWSPSFKWLIAFTWGDWLVIDIHDLR